MENIDKLKDYPEFTNFVSASLKKVMKTCARDTEYSLADNDTESENYPWFKNCVRNNVFLSPTLNQNKAVRQVIGGVYY